MRKVVIAMVIVFVCATAALAADPQKEPGGFRDLKWGDRIEGRAEFKLVENGSDGIEVWFERGNDKLLIGKAELEDISYRCADGRLVGVLISSRGRDNAELLRGTLNSALGKPDYDNDYENTPGVLWTFPNAKVAYIRKGDRITIAYTASKIERDIRREISERSKNSTNDEGVKDL